MWVMKRATVGVAYRAPGYLLSGTGNGVAEAGVSLSTGNRLHPDIGPGEDTAAGNPTFASTADTYVAVISKAAGTVAPIVSRYVKSTVTWTHYTLTTTVADQIATTMIELGAWQNGDYFDGWIGVAAFWEGAMSQTNKEALVTNWRTSDVWTSAHGQPAFLSELNVAGLSAVDLAGNASSITVTGTSLDAAETLDSWNFDGTGATAPLIPILVMAPPIHA